MRGRGSCASRWCEAGPWRHQRSLERRRRDVGRQVRFRHPPSCAACCRPAGAQVPWGCHIGASHYRQGKTASRSAGIDKSLGGGPHPHDDTHRCATGGTAGRERLRRRALRRPARAGVALPDQQADGRERDGTAGMEQAEMADFLKAIGQDVLEKPAEKLHDVKVGSAEACTAHFPGGEGDRAVRKADETVVGDGNREDIRGEVRKGGVAVVVGLTVDIPGDGPDLRVDGLQQAGVAHLFLEKRTVNG
jgi:hypothetical protein